MSDLKSVDEIFAELEELDRQHRARPWVIRFPIDLSRKIRTVTRSYVSCPPWTRVKWRWQRSVRGWSDYDVWGLDSYLERVIGGSILHLRDTSHGYPGTEGASTMVEWQTVLTNIANPLLVNTDRVVEGESCEDSLKREREEREAKTQALHELAHWFPALWD